MALKSPTSSLLSKVRETIRQYGMIEPAAGVVVGVSGGPDSVALLHLLNALRCETGFWIVAAHLDHRLRADSWKDAEFVREMCQQLGIQVEMAATNVKATAIEQGVSIEEAGRRCRYRFFEDVRISAAAQVIATAHHMDDELETFFLRVFRGSSLHGIKGISPVRGRIIHPLIRAARVETIRFLDAEGISYRIDPTNLESNTDRNFVRNRLFPMISEGFPDFRGPVGRTLEMLRSEDEFLDSQAQELCSEAASVTDDSLTLDVDKLRSAPKVLTARALLVALYKSAAREERWSRSNIESLITILHSGNPSARLNLPGGFVAKREYEILKVFKPKHQQKLSVDELIIAGPGEVEFLGTAVVLGFRIRENEGGLVKKPSDASAAFFDADKAAFPLTLRAFRHGDRFQPWGLEGSLKLKKFFINMKAPSALRRQIPLLVKNEEILWVLGLRRGQAAAVVPQTRRILEVTVLKGLEKLLGSRFPSCRD